MKCWCLARTHSTKGCEGCVGSKRTSQRWGCYWQSARQETVVGARLPWRRLWEEEVDARPPRRMIGVGVGFGSFENPHHLERCANTRIPPANAWTGAAVRDEAALADAAEQMAAVAEEAEAPVAGSEDKQVRVRAAGRQEGKGGPGEQEAVRKLQKAACQGELLPGRPTPG